MKRCKESEPALLSVIFSFLLNYLSKVKYHWSKSRKQENCQSIMFNEERLDLHGVGNLPHILTMKNKLSTFGAGGSVEYTYN